MLEARVLLQADQAELLVALVVALVVAPGALRVKVAALAAPWAALAVVALRVWVTKAALRDLAVTSTQVCVELHAPLTSSAALARFVILLVCASPCLPVATAARAPRAACAIVVGSVSL